MSVGSAVEIALKIWPGWMLGEMTENSWRGIERVAVKVQRPTYLYQSRDICSKLMMTVWKGFQR